MLGDALVQTSEVAGQWLATVAVYVGYDEREGPGFKRVGASMHEDKTTAIVGAFQQYLMTLGDR